MTRTFQATVENGVLEPQPTIFPAGLHLSARAVVVIGGGEVAERRIEKLLDCGAEVTLVAPEATERLQRLAADGAIRWEARTADTGDVQNAFLVFLATDSEAANRELAEAARRAGALVNRADRSGEGDFVVPMTIRSAGLTVAVHGGGASPAFSRWVARRVEQALGPEVEEFGRLVTAARQRVLNMDHLSQEHRARLIRRLVEEDLFEILTREGSEAAQQRVDEILKG